MATKTTYELQVKLGATTSPTFKQALSQAEQGLSGINSLSNKIMAGIAAGVTAAAATATYAISNAVDTYTEFEQEMATVQAISGASSAQFLELKEAALEAGSSTIFTATESASALEYMSLAGWNADQSITGLVPILEMAAATGKDLQTTSDLVTDSMSALGIGVDELDVYLDKLVEGNNDANSTAEQLMEALIKAGGASKTLGASLDDTITALGVLANNGKKGEDAGTALNAILVRLAGNTTALKELNKLGVDIWDDQGNFVGFEESLIRINDAMSDLTAEERSLSLKNVAGTNYYSQMAYLLDAVSASAETGESAWDELETQVENSTGALTNMYEITTDTLENAQKRLESAKEDMQIRLVDVFSDDAKEFIGWLAAELPNVTESLVDFAEAHKGEFADALEGLGEGIENLWENGIAAGTWIIKHKKAIVGALGGIAAGVVSIKANLAAIKIAEFFTNPVSAALAVAGLAVTAFGAVAGAIEDANEAAVNANLAEHFGNISLSMEELDALARQIVGEDSLNGVASMLSAAADTASALDDVSDTWEDLQKDSWKVNIGFNMTEADYEDYADTIESFIDGVESYAETKGYEVHIATSLLFGEGSSQDIEAGTFFAGIEAELEQYGADLYDYLYNETNGALLDGIIDIDEDAIVQEYLAKITNITAAISDAESQAKFDALKLQYTGADLTPETMAQLQEDIADYAQEVQDGALAAYESALTEYHARLELDPSYTQLDFDEDSAAAWEAYYNLQSDAAMNGINYMLDTINTAYPELQAEMDQYESDLTGILESYMDPDIVSTEAWETNPYLVIGNMQSDAYEAMKNNLIDEDRAALQQYLDLMYPTVELLGQVWEAYENAGEEIPEEIAEFQSNWQLLNDLVGNSPEQAAIDIWNTAENNSSFLTFLNNLDFEENESVQSFKEEFEGILEEEAIGPAIDGMYAYSQEYLDEVFSAGLSAFTTLDLKISPSFAIQDDISFAGTKLNYGNILSNAEGGIYTSPILTTFAEEGPETALPLDGSERARNLWIKSGQILGLLPQGNRDQNILAGISGSETKETEHNIQVSYNPVITIQGNATKTEVQSALALSLDDLREMIAEIAKEDKRVSFG